MCHQLSISQKLRLNFSVGVMLSHKKPLTKFLHIYVASGLRWFLAVADNLAMVADNFLWLAVVFASI